MEVEETKTGNKLLLYVIDSMLRMIDNQMPLVPIDIPNTISEFDFDSFEDNLNFYYKILSILAEDDNESTKIINNLAETSKSFLRNLINFLIFLKRLLDEKKTEALFKDSIIKIDISLIIGYLRNKYGSKIVESIDFFSLCTKELENKYDIKHLDYVTRFDDELKKDAEEKLRNLESLKKRNFLGLLNFLKNKYTNSSDFTNLENIKKIKAKFMNDLENKMNMNDLENNYFKKDDYETYINSYIDIKLSENGYNESVCEKTLYIEKKEELKNHLFFSDILKINLEEIETCIYLIYFRENIYQETTFFDIDKEFKKLEKAKNIIVKDNDYTENLKKIIEEESFAKDLKEILNCSSVKDYFEKVRKFEDEGYGMEILDNEEEIGDINNDFLKEGFHKLYNYLEKDKNFLSKLIVYKCLPQYKRAFVDPNMRIVINPIYFEFSQSMEENKRNNIFRAYLFIIILHEIVHLVKFMKNEKNKFDNIPKTPKNKEGGKMFINYLFNLPIIYYITDKQASEINKPENWNNLEKLSKIFDEQKKWYEKQKKENNEKFNIPSNKDKDFISFYLSLIDEKEVDGQNSSQSNDDWYDID